MFLLKHTLIFIILLISTSSAGWTQGGGRDLASSYSSNIKLLNNDTLELNWQASIDIDDVDSVTLENCKYSMIIDNVIDRRDNNNLIGQRKETDPVVNTYDIYAKNFSEWFRKNIKYEVENHCGRKSRKNSPIFVDMVLLNFMVNESDKYSCTATIHITLKDENNMKIWTGEIDTGVKIIGNVLNPYLYQMVISNAIVKIGAIILSLPIKD